MKNTTLLLLILINSLQVFGQSGESPLFKHTYIDSSGQVILEITKEQLNKDYLLMIALSSGIGSNDLGLDRGKLKEEKVVRFEKHGNKVLLIQPNLDYRAISPNPEEVKAVNEAFAKSVVYGFKVEKGSNDSTTKIDISDMLLEDLNEVALTLKTEDQGQYKIDKTRSAVLADNTLSFPLNIGFESLLTLTGEAKGKHIRSVTPSPDAVTFSQYVSFIELPDEGYQPRAFHPHSGYFNISYFDYATPINQDIVKRFITRHRLIKKNPDAERSEAVEPIIYYVDRGCPEPIKSALIDGASWWNEAFEAAGFINAFRVEELPKGAHPLDIRYNMIQWVHRSTRGWSYGASIIDPRTGEILKGHVSLGSLRVRQDYLIGQGILSPFKDDIEDDTPITEMALARLRQLSAHEVGHTIGLAHNFAASVDNRSSVMDYPHPLITSVSGDGIATAYAVGIGEWDKRAVVYGYGIPRKGIKEDEFLHNTIIDTKNLQLRYISDQDARPISSAHGYAHLWDNGNNPIQELHRIMTLRAKAISGFGPNAIPRGTPYSELEKIFVPIYFMHRYQIEAVGKLIGGYDYEYAVKGDPINYALKKIPAAQQESALKSLLDLLKYSNVNIPPSISKHLYPSAQGYPDTRESLPSNASFGLDEQAIKEALFQLIFDILLDPARLNRIHNDDSVFGNQYLPSISKYLSKLENDKTNEDDMQIAIIIYVNKLMELYDSQSINQKTKIAIHNLLRIIQVSSDLSDYSLLIKRNLIDFFNTPVADRKVTSPKTIPPGSPIGILDQMLHQCSGIH